MASTDGLHAARIDRLTLADLSAALALSEAAAWNQNAADWRTMLTLGHGWCVRASAPSRQPEVVASIIVLPYSGGFAWLSMVLVRRDFQRRGLASMLLRKAIAELTGSGLMPVLDATPAGHEVYRKEGFEDAWRFRRYRREAIDGRSDRNASITGSARGLHERDWPAIGALDAKAFGADRLQLLRSLASRAPQCAWVLERDGRIEGYALGRDGREATQVGPLVAAVFDDARSLLDCALGAVQGPVYVDIHEQHPALMRWLEQHGFTFQRPFTRMVHPLPGTVPAVAPGDATRVVLVAGPELG